MIVRVYVWQDVFRLINFSSGHHLSQQNKVIKEQKIDSGYKVDNYTCSPMNTLVLFNAPSIPFTVIIFRHSIYDVITLTKIAISEEKKFVQTHKSDKIDNYN